MCSLLSTVQSRLSFCLHDLESLILTTPHTCELWKLDYENEPLREPSAVVRLADKREK